MITITPSEELSYHETVVQSICAKEYTKPLPTVSDLIGNLTDAGYAIIDGGPGLQRGQTILGTGLRMGKKQPPAQNHGPL